MTFVVKVPGINGLGKTKGCEKAGNAIIKTLKEIYSSEKGIPIDAELLDLEEIHLDNKNIEQANQLTYKNSLKTFEEKNKVVFLGGDHSISYSLVKGFLDYCNSENKEPCLIVFDAHADCMPVTKGAENSPTHEEWLRGLINSGFPPENILLVGVRNMWKDENLFLKEKGIKKVDINLFLEDIDNACDTIMEFIGNRELYISIDIDAIDPAFAPATGYKEPGGFTSRQFLYLIQRFKKNKKLKAVDIVEVNPEKDKKYDNITIKLGARILSELL